MKKMISVFLAILLLTLVGCGKTFEKTLSPSVESDTKTEEETKSTKISGELKIQSEKAVSVKLSGYGKETVVEEKEKVEKIIQLINEIEFKQTEEDVISMPGAQSLRITVNYEDGDKVEVTLPAWKINHRVYESAPNCVTKFSEFI